ncbi:MAG TPA: cyclic nucleotide-binding domain-containing protein [Acidimicrobiia bacterium]
MPVDKGELHGRWTGLKADFAPTAAIRTISSGIIIGVANALLITALMSLIFRDSLADALPTGIAHGLIASAVIGVIVAVGSSFPGLYAGVQDASTAIIALSAAAIAGALAGSVAVDTVVAMMAATSLATGATLLLVGYLGFGEVARFVPFPVIGGLLAGTGYLILAGALEILGLTAPADLSDAGSVGVLWPGLGLAVVFYLATRRSWSSRIYLLLLVIGVGGFHLVTQLAGVGKEESLQRGWLLGPFGSGAISPRSVIEAFGQADWGLIAGQGASLATILVIIPITLLLYISALEIETETGVDMNHELTATGWANLASGVVGGPPGYVFVADSVIVARLIGSHRGPAVVAALSLLAVVAAGGGMLELLPVFVVGGLLLFVGAEFLHEWLWASRHRMSGLDYTLMVGIAVVIAVVGFLPGVATGLVAAIVLFVMRYSRIDVIKHSLTGAEQRSNIERSEPAADYLAEAGLSIEILELQGFIFFGTASRILARIRALPSIRPDLRFVLCDFRRVTGVDSSAVAVFELIANQAREHGFSVILSGMGETVGSQFDDVVTRYGDVFTVASDLDHGLARCEDELLADGGLASPTGPSLPEGLSEAMGSYLVSRSIPAGEILMQQGDPSPGIFLITAGRATVLMEEPDGTIVRLRTLLSGTVLGEISLYRGEPCTATVVAESECAVLHLAPDRFEDLCVNDPEVAARLHEFVARILAGRVSHANRTIRALRD